MTIFNWLQACAELGYRRSMRLDKGQIEVIDDEMAKVLREKPPSERIAIGFSMWKEAQQMLKSHLKSLHPDWSPEMINREVARRLSHGAV
jgi:hypothetical protein